ncbi:MAG: oligosaccharide repeat unit polymerase family protein [Candidatus Korarchaeum sp.]
MLLSMLIRSIGSSFLGRRLNRAKFSELIRSSITYRFVHSVYEILSRSYESSCAARLLRGACSSLGRALSFRKPPVRGDNAVIKRLFELLFSPFALPIGLLTFFMLSLVRISENTILLLLLTIVAMILGIALARAEEDLGVRDARGVVLLLGVAMFLIGYASFIVQLANTGGIPLLDEQVRRRLSVILNYLSWTTVPGAAFILSSSNLRKCDAIAFSLLGFIPSLFLAFRTEMIAYLLAVTLVLYKRRMIGLGFMIPALLLAVISFLGIGALRSIATGLVQNPLLSVLYRPTITVAALDTIVRIYGMRPVTNGYIHLAAISSLGLISGPRYGPRNLIGRYTMGRTDVSTTATLIGGPLLDWGLIGALGVSLMYSYMLALSHRFAGKSEALLGPYAVIYSYTIVGIETGILDLNVYIYLILSALIVVFSLRPGER